LRENPIVSSLRDSICVKSYPALPCRATDCPIPSGLIPSSNLRFFSTPKPVPFKKRVLTQILKALISSILRHSRALPSDYLEQQILAGAACPHNFCRKTGLTPVTVCVNYRLSVCPGGRIGRLAWARGVNNEFDEMDNFRSAGNRSCFGAGLGCVCTTGLATDTDVRAAGRLGPGWTAARCAKWTNSPAH
jgi:hypothetical protein